MPVPGNDETELTVMFIVDVKKLDNEAPEDDESSSVQVVSLYPENPLDW